MIEILDSTLRDGAQSENVSFSAADKRAVIKALADFGIPFIEAGNPGSNPKDSEIFENSGGHLERLVAFGATRRKAMRCEADRLFMSLMDSPAKNVSIFGKASVFHAEEILGVSLDENLAMISDSIRFAVNSRKTVFFDAEHFSTATKLIPIMP
jgi:2-isopropylmalate synthase